MDQTLLKNFYQKIYPIYHIFGEEKLLIEESVNQLRSYLRSKGYRERLRFTSEPGFDWNILLQQSQSVSIFTEKKIIELIIPKHNLGKSGSRSMISYAQNIDGTIHTILIVISEMIEQRTRRMQWFKAIDAVGMIIECPSLKKKKLPDWIRDRMNRTSIEYTPEAITRLAHYVEGNLLAAAQSINMISMLYPTQQVTVEMIDQMIIDHSRFSVFSFLDACLSGSVFRSIRILQSLRREKIDPVFIIWGLSRDIRTLYHLLSEQKKGMNPCLLLHQYGIFSNRSDLMRSALNRMSLLQCLNLIKKLDQIDLMSKGALPLQKQNIWEEIESISLRLCGISVC